MTIQTEVHENETDEEFKYKHRSVIKSINDIEDIKKELVNKLGYTGVYFFLTELYKNIEYPAPYLEVEKGLFLLYHIVSGISGKEINKCIPYTSFYAFYKKFWITNYTELNKKVDNCLYKMFSNIKIRILSAKIKNPENYKYVTFLLDGHDSTIDYSKPDIEKQKRWSYKLKTSGIRTQVLADVNDMITAVSVSKLCGESSDGTMFLNMKLYTKIDKRDCVALDGGYALFI